MRKTNPDDSQIHIFGFAKSHFALSPSTFDRTDPKSEKKEVETFTSKKKPNKEISPVGDLRLLQSALLTNPLIQSPESELMQFQLAQLIQIVKKIFFFFAFLANLLHIQFCQFRFATHLSSTAMQD
jgi:hypothetical protein